ncbi:phage head morphogenesis protein [Pseudaestuariivita sp.]|uniref:phage head morphogenesis protein n=1 Tax=Pseudaestuariivita sp. TaxID=2211669 RepID=UPI004059A100
MAEFRDKPGYAFGADTPPEVSNFLRNKRLTPSFSWRDVEPEEHAVAFTVAKAMQADVLRDIRDAVQSAIDNGETFAQFQKELRPKLNKLGWWGVKEMTDPVTGQRELVQLGSPRRLRTIYRANLRAARAAGQWERIERTKAALPFLEYNLGPSERHRPHHENKQGLILPVDDPFWDNWMPPNGWGCNCWVRQITRREAERRGVSEPPNVRVDEKRNRRTGEIRQIPRGIDPGWDRNPGKLRLRHMEQLLLDRITTMSPAARDVAVKDIATSWQAQRVLDGTASGAVPVAIVPEALSRFTGGGTLVRMTSHYGDKLLGENRDVRTDQLLILNEALETGRIALDESDNRQRLLILSRGKRPWKFVLHLLPQKREAWIVSIYRVENRHWRSLLRREKVVSVRE